MSEGSVEGLMDTVYSPAGTIPKRNSPLSSVTESSVRSSSVGSPTDGDTGQRERDGQPLICSGLRKLCERDEPDAHPFPVEWSHGAHVAHRRHPLEHDGTGCWRRDVRRPGRKSERRPYDHDVSITTSGSAACPTRIECVANASGRTERHQREPGVHTDVRSHSADLLPSGRRKPHASIAEQM